MLSRYSYSTQIQPIRNIPVAATDIYVIYKQGDTIDKLAYNYYNSMGLNWIIMCANPTFFQEFEIPYNTELRIPFPLERVWPYLGIDGTDSN